MISFSLLETAAKHIEVDAEGAFDTVVEMVGVQTALALLIGHLRHRLGSTLSIPATPEISEQVLYIIKNGHAGPSAAALTKPVALFYTDTYHPLDNCSAYSIFWRKRKWPTLEHAYQAEKFTSRSIIKEIFNAGSPFKAKKIAHEFSSKKRPEWDDLYKISTMKALMNAKANQHPEVLELLLATEGLDLVENSPTDSFWGRGPNWKGENMVGKLWTEIRRERIKMIRK